MRGPGETVEKETVETTRCLRSRRHTIVGVHVWSYPQVLTFALDESGVMDVYGTDALERKDMRSEAEQDVLDHTPELDKVLESLYTVVRVGFRGIVSYVLY